MKWRILGVVGVMAAALAVIAVTSSATTGGQISVNDAKKAIVAAAGEREESLVLKETIQFRGTAELRIKGAQAVYGVNAATGEVETVYFFNPPVGDSKKVGLGLDEAKDRAVNIATSFFSNFPNNLELRIARLSQHGDTAHYEFHWQETRGGIPYPTYVRVTLNPENGLPLSYASQRHTIATQPKIELDRQSAIANALALAGSEFTEVGFADLDVIVDQGKAVARWTVLVQTADKSRGQLIRLDAATGKEFSGTRGAYNAGAPR